MVVGVFQKDLGNPIRAVLRPPDIALETRGSIRSEKQRSITPLEDEQGSDKKGLASQVKNGKRRRGYFFGRRDLKVSSATPDLSSSPRPASIIFLYCS